MCAEPGTKEPNTFIVQGESGMLDRKQETFIGAPVTNKDVVMAKGANKSHHSSKKLNYCSHSYADYN